MAAVLTATSGPATIIINGSLCYKKSNAFTFAFTPNKTYFLPLTAYRLAKQLFLFDLSCKEPPSRDVKKMLFFQSEFKIRLRSVFTSLHWRSLAQILNACYSFSYLCLFERGRHFAPNLIRA